MLFLILGFIFQTYVAAIVAEHSSCPIRQNQRIKHFIFKFII